MKKKEKITLGVIALLLIVTIIGVSYAAFTFAQSGKNLNTMTTGIMQMSYEESSNIIKMTGALPTTDATGKVRLNEGEYFDFTVSSTIQGDAQINWEIAAEDFSSNTFDGKNVKLYLTSLDSSGNETEVMAPKVFTKKTTENKKTGRPANMMSLATGTMSASTSTKYRLRMWVDENYNPQGDGGNKKFAVRINVYGKVYEAPSQAIDFTDSNSATVVPTFYQFCQESGSKVTIVEGMDGVDVPASAIQSFDLSEKQDGSVVAYIDTNSDGTYKFVLGGINGVLVHESLRGFGRIFQNVKEYSLSCLDTSNVTDMNSMFAGCSSLSILDISNFDTSKVTDMNQMFSGCSSLTSLNLSNFDTSKVTTMGRMFTGCNSLTSLDLSSFNTSKVTNMYNMFDSCSSLTSLDVSNFDTSKVTDMYRMFCKCISLTSLDLSNFDTSKVTDMTLMFCQCSKMQNINVSSKWVIGSACDVSGMFDDCGVSAVTYV